MWLICLPRGICIGGLLLGLLCIKCSALDKPVPPPPLNEYVHSWRVGKGEESGDEGESGKEMEILEIVPTNSKG